MILDEALLAAVAEEGNPALASQLLRDDRRLKGTAKTACRKAIDRATPRGPGFFVPLVHKSDGMTAEVRAVRGSAGHSAAFDASAREAADRAVGDAWAVLGGPGDAPDVGIEVPLAERLDRAIHGASVYLPALLAAVAELSGLQPLRSTMASGTFVEPLGGLDAKLALFQERRGLLRLDRLLLASKGLASGPPGERPPLLQVHDAAGAVVAAFGYLPWHPDADVLRVHAYCGPHRSDPPPSWAGRDWRPVELSETLTPETVDAEVGKVLRELAGATRVELSLGGPILLAARLAQRLKNRRGCELNLVHGRGERWLSNLSVWSEASPDVAEARQADLRLLLTTRGAMAPGWKSEPLPNPLTARDLAEIVPRVVGCAARASRVDLAFDGPYPLAWAVAQALSNRASVRYFHRLESGEYQLWF